MANASVTPAVGATAPLASANAPLSSVVPAVPKGMAIVGSVPNPKYAPLAGIGVAAIVLVSILLIAKYAKGFVSNISALLGIVIGAVVAMAMGLMTFEKVVKAN